MKAYKVGIAAILFGGMCLLGACGNKAQNVEEAAALETMTPVAVPAETLAPIPTPEPTPTPIPTPTPFPEYDINLMMVGDNLMHMGIVKTGEQEDGSYNYDFLFEGISEFLDEAEIKMINQETILGGNDFGFSGYPYFNSPTEVGEAIAKAGFNVVLHSSNHTADKKLQGILNCVEFWEQYPDVLAVGIYGEIQDGFAEDGMEVKEAVMKNEELSEKNSVVISVTKVEASADGTGTNEAVQIPILEIGDITFAILNYAYAPNMASFPEEYEGHMDMLCDYDESSRLIDFTTLHEDVLTDIAAAEGLADFVIVCPHWGTEYTTTPSKYQKNFAMQMTEAGADIILGTHPHVVQPVEWVEAENGNKALCYYSLGNYVSTQKKALCMLEAMAWITIHVDEEGACIVEENTGVLPMVCHYNAMPVRMESVYLLEDYTEEQAASHGIRAYGGVELRVSDLLEWTAEVFEDWVLTADQILQDGGDSFTNS